MLPGLKPSRLLVRSPLLWIPMTFLTRGQPNPWATITYASVFNWGLLLAWVSFIVWPGGSKPVSSPPELAVHDAPRAAP
jgi:hypothetical protein